MTKPTAILTVFTVDSRQVAAWGLRERLAETVTHEVERLQFAAL